MNAAPGRTNTLVIEMAEGVAFPLLLASPVARFLAWGVDAACIMVACQVATLALGWLRWIDWSFAMAFLTLAYFLVSVGYAMALEWFWRGQTFGKRLLRLRVVDVQGLRLQPSQVVVRNLLRFVDSLPAFYLVGGVAGLLNRRGQRLGDLAANTLVVRVPASAEPDLAQVLAGKYNSFRDHPHLAARLRQRVSPGEAAIALQALLRREELEPAARVELFAAIAAHLREAVRFPPEACEGITDEQYVRNAVDLLFQGGRGA
jgi:uncharacterized RDD family membrane protein YckC